MAVYQDKGTGKWEVQAWAGSADGRLKKKHKRGFGSKEDAMAWEAAATGKCDLLTITVSGFWEVYRTEVFPTLRPTTRKGKGYMFRSRIEPFFGSMQMGLVKAADIVRWRNELIEAGCSATYMRTLRNQLAALFNHAVRFYGLSSNPVSIAGSFGSREAPAAKVWGKAEYERFSYAIMDKPVSHMAFEILYWCGLRKGELLALTPDDIDFSCGEIRVSKSYARIDGRDVISAPKTPRSARRVVMPRFLEEELAEFLSGGGVGPDDRIFPFTGHWLAHEMHRGCSTSGVNPIRIHDLRHSHVSLLVAEGLSVVDIAERLGHTAADVTLRYAHLLPGRQAEIAARLDRARDW